VPTSVSVALCTHNGVPYIEQQVASILAQTVPPQQIVLSDDASTDDTVARVRQAVADFTGPAIELVVLENTPALGVVANFEQAVRACTGDIIALCDQDDLWVPGRLETLLARFASQPELLLVHSDARLVDSDGTPLGYSLFDAISLGPDEIAEIHAGNEFAALLRRNVVTGATTAFRRSLLDVALPFARSWVHDEWLAMVAAIVGRTDVMTDQLIDYRQHSANQIGARKLTVAGIFHELRLNRTARGIRLVTRAEELEARLDSFGAAATATVRDLVARKVAHERRRRDLPALRIARVPGVLRELRGGGYSMFGRPRASIVRDLLQPGE
jgi:glycosyltransferase involved in cell wall biosynthesis